MSAIVAIENIPDPNTTMLTVPQELVDQLVRENSSMAGFSAGETVSATDLLYGCLLSSGGEATGTLALYVGGGEESGVRRHDEQKGRGAGLRLHPLCKSNRTAQHITYVYGDRYGKKYSAMPCKTRPSALL